MFIKRLIDYYYTRVNIFDILRSKNKYNKNKVNLGWLSVFPPTHNGVASATYYIIKELQKKENINLFLIPYEGNFKGRKYPPRLDKRIFSNFNIAKMDSSKLDLVVLFLLGEACSEVVDKLNAPYIIWQTVHDCTKEIHEKELFEEIKSCNSQKVFLTTQSAAIEYKKNGLRNVSYLPLGVDRNIFKPVARSEEFVVLFLSRMVKYKGIMQFLQSIPIVLNKCPKIKFKLHAPTNKVIKPGKEIVQMIESLENSHPNNFDFELSWLSYEAMYKVYKNVSVFVFPSNSEGFGVPLVEAMSCGIPSIVLDKSPINEIIKNGYTGFCLDIDKKNKDKFNEVINRNEGYSCLDYRDWAFPSPEDIADKIIYLYKNPEVYDKISKNCIEYSKNYDLDMLVDEFVKQTMQIADKR